MPSWKHRVCTVVLPAAVVMAVSCSGDSPTSPTSTSTGPVDTNTITIANGSVSPNFIRVAVGSTVTLVNNDSRARDLNSDPHPSHTDCPALNWGPLQPGESRASAPLTTARTCGYHDHIVPSNTSLQGRILIQ
ncbi:MAG TPA: hypothetical protein VGQ10_07670 [Vicinamibacterales bacterium]|nr:hypothetical protein [Vicinamibacterales bacterium]